MTDPYDPGDMEPNVTQLLVEAADAIAVFLDAVHASGIGHELTQRIGVAATPVIVRLYLEGNVH
jgi:hypothetical protein